MQHLLKISFIRNRMYSRAVEQFIAEQEALGIQLRNPDVPERLCAVRTLLLDSALIMQGRDTVRSVAAPLEICDVGSLRRQRAGMVLSASISLTCDGDVSLEALAREMNFTRERMLRTYPQADFFPYDTRRRMETTVHRDANGLRAYSKGDPKAVLRHCTHVLDGRERLMEKRDRNKIRAVIDEMEDRGLQTLGFATRWREDEGDFEQAMVFLGVIGRGDLPDAHAPALMEALRCEGVRPILTASDTLTSGAVKHSGVLRPAAGWMTAEEFDNLTDYELHDACEHADAYLGMDWRRKERLAKAMRVEGSVATLSPHPRSGMVMAMGKGTAPDVIIEGNDIGAIVRLLADCRVLRDSFSA